ncbi:MAG: hypothetical protein OCU12_07720 [Methanophagales archaeon]|nr:hypothetical protein [Methanophagales archaeon]
MRGEAIPFVAAPPNSHNDGDRWRGGRPLAFMAFPARLSGWLCVAFALRSSVGLVLGGG